MAKQPTGKAVLDRIDKRLKALGLSDNKASEEATGSRHTLRTLRRNVAEERQRGISSETIHKFAPVLQTSVEWLLNEIGPEVVQEPQHIESSSVLVDQPQEDGWVDVVGYVGAGAQAHRYEVGQGELERVPPPDPITKATVAVEIRGGSLGEIFDRWLVFYDEVKRPLTEDLIGELCVVGLPDDRVLIKKIIKSKRKPGLFDLLSNTEPPIEGAEIVWAARVKKLIPRWSISWGRFSAPRWRGQ